MANDRRGIRPITLELKFQLVIVTKSWKKEKDDQHL